MKKPYKNRKTKSNKTALTKTVNQVVAKAIAHKRCEKMFSMTQSTGDLNNPTNAHRWNEEVGRIPKYNPSELLLPTGNLSQARVSNKIRLEKLYLKFGFLNKSAYNTCVRIYIFRNTNENEVYNTNGSNLNMSYNGAPISYSTDFVIGQMQSFNYNLVQRKSDLLFDKTYTIPTDHSASTYTIPYRRVFTVKKSIKRDLIYENRSDTANALDNKGPKYYIVWTLMTQGPSDNTSLVEGDLFLDQCFSEDA